ncbi:MAG: hypothetical protein KIS67_28030 [Verrucomicrobiae bacterium]|nr:hypothetical protein [Verrucomicrobiae bacterium]
MSSISVLNRGWTEDLGTLVDEAEKDLLICSPYVTRDGTDFVAGRLSSKFRIMGRLTFVTDLSPVNVAQGSTDPDALNSLSKSVSRFTVMHLPRLHAKVYISDCKRAVVTSGNLTRGGLMLNYEYGIDLRDPQIVGDVRRDVTAYADLGAIVSPEQLSLYCQAAANVRDTSKRQQASAARALRQAFARTMRVAEDELIRLRLAGGAVHTVFQRTILYLLQKHHALTTEQIHATVESIHPDLCDNAVDRVIGSKSFGKKWKHAVRTAQQQLKRKELIQLIGMRWTLVDAGSAAAAKEIVAR